MVISGIKFVLACIITNVFLLFLTKKCNIHFKIISNLVSNFINTINFTPHENNLLIWIFPLNDMQATLPPLQKVSENVQNKERATYFEIWKFRIYLTKKKKSKRRYFFELVNFSKEILLKIFLLGGQNYDRPPLAQKGFAPLDSEGWEAFLIWTFLIQIYDATSHLTF